MKIGNKLWYGRMNNGKSLHYLQKNSGKKQFLQMNQKLLIRMHPNPKLSMSLK